MGRQSYSCVGFGMTENEARRNASENAYNENGHQEGYSGDINSSTYSESKCVIKPKPAKQCLVEHKNIGVTRKWETLFIIREQFAFDRGELGWEKTKGDALKKAKELAIKHNAPMTIEVVKRIVGKGTDVAVVKPKKSTMGKWKFWGEARC